jgi:hypothetical protein
MHPWIPASAWSALHGDCRSLWRGLFSIEGWMELEAEEKVRTYLELWALPSAAPGAALGGGPGWSLWEPKHVWLAAWSNRSWQISNSSCLGGRTPAL